MDWGYIDTLLGTRRANKSEVRLSANVEGIPICPANPFLEDSGRDIMDARFKRWYEDWFGGWRNAPALLKIASELQSCSKGFLEKI